MNEVVIAVAALVGVVLGAVGVWLLTRSRLEGAARQSQDLEAAKARVVELEKTEIALKDKAAERDELAGTVASLREEASKATLAHREAETQIHALEAKVTDLERREREANEATIKREGSLKSEFNARIADLEMELTAVRSRRDDLADELGKLQTSIEERNKAIEEQKALIAESERKLKDTFEALAAKTLSGTTEQFKSFAEQVLKQREEAAKSDIAKTVDPIRTMLEEYRKGLSKLTEDEAKREVSLKEQLEALGTTVREQREATTRLQGILRGPTQRGRAGELLLEALFERAGLAPSLYEFQTSVEGEEGRLRPDCVVSLPGERKVVIDVKTPLDAYNSAMDLDDPEARETQMKAHAKVVRNTVVALSQKKYADAVKDADFVVMYLPIEASLSAALLHDPELTSFAWERRVMLMSPTLLFAFLQVIAQGWRQEKLSESAAKIAEVGKDLYDRIAVFAGHMETTGKRLDDATKAYDKAVASFDSRLRPAAERLHALEAKSDKPLAEPSPLGKTTRKPDLGALPEPKADQLSLDD